MSRETDLVKIEMAKAIIMTLDMREMDLTMPSIAFNIHVPGDVLVGSRSLPSCFAYCTIDGAVFMDGFDIQTTNSNGLDHP